MPPPAVLLCKSSARGPSPANMAQARASCTCTRRTCNPIHTTLTHSARYYVLVAACVLARNLEWLRKACLAAALLLPAVGSLHALVLASLHVNGPLPTLAQHLPCLNH